MKLFDWKSERILNLNDISSSWSSMEDFSIEKSFNKFYDLFIWIGKFF